MNSRFGPVLLTIVWGLIVKPNEGAMSILKWNKHVGDFEPVGELPSLNKKMENRALQTRREETHNFNGKPLRLTYFPDKDIVNFYDNDTKVSGIYGDIWTILSEMLNFTLVVERSESRVLTYSSRNRVSGGILTQLWINQTDIIPRLEANPYHRMGITMTPYFWETKASLFGHQRWEHDKNWMFKPFPVEVWCIVIIFIVIMSLASFAIARITMRRRRSRFRVSLSDHIFDTFAEFCNQRNTVDHNFIGVRILRFTIGAFTSLIIIGYGTRLLYSITHEVFKDPIRNFRDAYDDANIHLIVRNGSAEHFFFQQSFDDSVWHSIMNANRLIVVSNLEELKQKVCSDPKSHALVTDEEIMLINNNVCNIVPEFNFASASPMGSGISKKVKNKRSIDIGIMKLREFGISKAIRRKWLKRPIVDSRTRQAELPAIGFDRISSILMILTVGIVASIVICVVENIVFAVKNRRNERNLSRRVFTIERAESGRDRPRARPAVRRVRNLDDLRLFDTLKTLPPIQN